MEIDRLVSYLNELSVVCEDDERIYREAADHALNADLKRLFTDESAIRERMATELQQEVVRLGYKPATTGSAMGELRRIWLDFKNSVTLSDETLLKTLESIEDSTIDTYQSVLKEGVPANILTLLQQHYDHVQKTHEEIRLLRDTKRYKTAKV